jgi:hypothetical protein
MGLHWQDRQYLSDSEPYEEEDFEADFPQDLDSEAEEQHLLKNRHLIRKKLEERLEKEKLRHEWNDYEDEIHEDFDWDKYKKR